MTEEEQTPQAIQLQHTWVLYYDEQTQQRTQQQNDYSDRLKPLGTFSTVQEFWRYWNNLHVADFPLNSNLRIFKQGIHPSWEDPNNALGGKWLIDVVQHKSTQAFMLTVLAMIGEQLAHSDELCGAVFSVRSVGNRINVWNKNAHNKEILERCEEELKAVLQPVKINVFRYQPHRIDVQPPKKEPQPSKTALAAAAATNSSAEAPIAGGATDPPKSKNNDLLAVPAPGRAALSSSQGDEDDFGSPFIELSAELTEKQKLEDSSSSASDGPAPLLSKHRKTLSMGALPASALQSSGDGSIQLSSIASLDAAAMKRRLRRRGGRRSSSGNHSAAISLALGTLSGESSAEPSPRDPLTPSSSSENLFAAQTAALTSSAQQQQQQQQTDQIMTPSITERKYLQRKRNSVDRSKKHSRNNSDNDVEGKRRLYSRPSRENLHGDSKKRSAASAFWRSFLIFFFAAFFLIIAVGLISQYSCEYLHILCT